MRSFPVARVRRLARGHTPTSLRRCCLSSARLCSALPSVARPRGHGTRAGTLPQRPGLRGRRDGQAQEGGSHHWHHRPGECGSGGPSPFWRRRGTCARCPALGAASVSRNSLLGVPEGVCCPRGRRRCRLWGVCSMH